MYDDRASYNRAIESRCTPDFFSGAKEELTKNTRFVVVEGHINIALRVKGRGRFYCAFDVIKSALPNKFWGYRTIGTSAGILGTTGGIVKTGKRRVIGTGAINAGVQAINAARCITNKNMQGTIAGVFRSIGPSQRGRRFNIVVKGIGPVEFEVFILSPTMVEVFKACAAEGDAALMLHVIRPKIK